MKNALPVQDAASPDSPGPRPTSPGAARGSNDAEALRQSVERQLLYVTKAVESTSEAIGISDAQGRHFYQNKALSDLFGYATAEELQAAGGGAAVVKDPAVARAVFDSILNGGSWAGELEMVTKSGRVFEAYERADAIKDHEGNVVGAIGIVSDISGRKRSEDVLRNLKKAEEARDKMEAQFLQAQKMEAVGRLAGGVAHDFNNMLGVILGHVELAIEQVDPGHPLVADLEGIRAAANRSADVTRRLLAFARKQTVAPRILDLNETMVGMLAMLRRLIGEDINLAWQPGADLWSIKMDPSQIDQILANLSVNARDAIADVGTITIETRNSMLDADYCANHLGSTPGEYVRFSVSDTGCGMDADTLSHLFEPFFTTKAVGKGTGLGLATVYGAVRQNNGFIDVSSKPGRGTTFTIYLPRDRSNAKPVQTEGVEGAALRGDETILVVEDEPALLKLTTLMLKRQGYTVLVARSPGEAIRLATDYAGQIHLLLTDVVLPEMNGWDLAAHVLSVYPDIQRLFMSGYTSDVVTQHGVLDHGVYFIQKPFSREDLGAKVREALGG
ncbi:MAG: ATP-binding protein [Acidobacteria bacterium]|nr:ATP-binding protein [Acidobacteriota bacterium]